MTSESTAYFAENVAPSSSTGLKSRDRACSFSASKSRPASLNSSTAKLRWTQPSICGCVPEGSSRTTSNMVLVLEFFTVRSEEHTSELQSLMRISYAVFCLKKKNKNK